MNRQTWNVWVAAGLLMCAASAHAQEDPGARQRPEFSPPPGIVDGLNEEQQETFYRGAADFGRILVGHGPRFNSDDCTICHQNPTTGGSSSERNGQRLFGSLPVFMPLDGPTGAVRFRFKPDGTPDGSVHQLFVHPSCDEPRPDFNGEFARGNVVLRITTPVFGTGLMENIADGTIEANLIANKARNAALGISGRVNADTPDGGIGRFGWKAQIRSLLFFTGEAFNVELGGTSPAFPIEPGPATNCRPIGPTPNLTEQTVADVTAFQQFLAGPPAFADKPGGADSINRGRATFSTVGCAQCHTPTLRTADSSVRGLHRQNVNLYSDLALHNMGPGLADGISQGSAGPDEFRSAPLWGTGQRLFFMHDGRARDLITAILSHRSEAAGGYAASEANAVINNYDALSIAQKQDLLNFLRSL